MNETEAAALLRTLLGKPPIRRDLLLHDLLARVEDLKQAVLYGDDRTIAEGLHGLEADLAGAIDESA